MTLISGKISLVVPVLLAFLLTTASAVLLNSSIYIASHGTIDYSSVLSSYQKSELRGVLVKFMSWYEHDDDLICETLANYSINAVYLEVVPTSWTGVDMNEFEDMINACRKYGLDFHVLVIYGPYDPTYTQDYFGYGFSGSNPDWRMIDVNGNPVNWVCLQRASTRARFKQVIETMVTTFPGIVDINHDYVRYPTSAEGIDSRSVCYCDECKAAFAAWLLANGKPAIGTLWPGPFASGGARWKDFAEWRCNPINDIVRDVRQWALAKNSNMRFTADTWIPYWVTEPETYKEAIGQDPAYWISQGWLESIDPMIYTGSMSTLTLTVDTVIQYQTGNDKGAIPLVPFITQGGPGVGVNAVPTSFWVQEIDYLRQKGCNGFIIWRYGGPGFSETGTPFTDIRPYLAAIRDTCAKGAYPVFKQSRPYAMGSTITWQTTLNTTGKVEYSKTAMFTAIPKTGSLLPYVDIDYVPGTILSESTPNQNHLIIVPLSPPFYFRIRDVDSNVELASPVYLNTG